MSDVIEGWRQNLSGGRFVWLGKLPEGDFAMKFCNAEGEESGLKFSPEAMLALTRLYREHYEHDDSWNPIAGKLMRYIIDLSEGKPGWKMISEEVRDAT